MIQPMRSHYQAIIFLQRLHRQCPAPQTVLGKFLCSVMRQILCPNNLHNVLSIITNVPIKCFRCSQIGSDCNDGNSVENGEDNNNLPSKENMREKTPIQHKLRTSQTLFSSSISNGTSLIEKEQNCCNNEIIVSSQLEGREQRNQDDDTIGKKHDRQRDRSTKVR